MSSLSSVLKFLKSVDDAGGKLLKGDKAKGVHFKACEMGLVRGGVDDKEYPTVYWFITQMGRDLLKLTAKAEALDSLEGRCIKPRYPGKGEPPDGYYIHDEQGYAEASSLYKLGKSLRDC